MRKRYLVDSNILIYLCNGSLAEPLPDGHFGCSIITEIEVLSYPSLSDEETELIRCHLAGLTVYAVDDAIASEAVRLRKLYRIKLPDALIAATALVSNSVLLTNDLQLHSLKEIVCKYLKTKPVS